MNPPQPTPLSSVTVRMYRQGLGDCFLLMFQGVDGTRRTMLIDCGVLKNSPDERPRMREVIEHLRSETGGELDVLVATHEHWDHLSGFIHGEDLLPGLKAGEVWLAWTENPAHPLGQALRARRAQALRAVQAALTRMHLSLDPRVNETAERISAVMEFFGLETSTSSSDLGAAPGGGDGASGPLLGASPGTAKGLELAAKCGPARYCSPGEVLQIPGVGGVRIFVLGPPVDEKLIKKSDPTKKGQEVYEKGFAMDLNASLLHAAESAGGGEGEGSAARGADPELEELSFPFDRVRQKSPEAARADAWFRRHYFGALQPGDEAVGIAPRERMDWRRIDDDWTEAASQLALQLDSDTNNTSLVLAIELIDSGKVLLFPGDAQVGNWLSWETLKWGERELGNGAAEVRAHDLLRRTVFYKVGHHASHNATLRAKGLELMESPELVAMIPVDEEVAHRPKGSLRNGWDMPFPPLLERLLQKTRGRVIRADRDLPEEVPEHSSLTAEEWAAFRAAVADAPDRFKTRSGEPSDRRLYVQYTIPVRQESSSAASIAEPARNRGE